MKTTKFLITIFSVSLVSLSSCQKDDTSLSGNYSTDNQKKIPRGGGIAGAVYVMDNAASGNNIMVYSRAANGMLSSSGMYATGGMGTGNGLGSQGSLILDDNYLFACNAGSNEITVFNAAGTTLTQADIVSSEGMMPISLTVYGNILYVLNAGGNGNISGFTIDMTGQLSYIAGSDQPLSSSMAGGAQIQFNTNGDYLVVTEKMTNMITTYPVDGAGMAGAGTSYPSVGDTPFGFDFGKNNTLIVSDAFEGNPGVSAMTSYSLSGSGSPDLITGPVGTNQTAACWVVVTNNGRFCYTTNTGSANITGYSIDHNGALALLDSDGVTGETGAGPIDMALSNNSLFLYALNAGSNSISMFFVHTNGALSPIGETGGLPSGAAGLAAK